MTLLSHRREELGASPFGSREPEELEEEVQADLNELEELRAEAARKPKPLWGIVLMVLAVAAAALYTSLDVLAFMIAAAVFCVGAVVLFILFQLRPAWLLAAFNAVLSALALFEPFADIVGGMFSIPAIVYYLSVIGLFLFLTGQALERRRWN